MARHLSSRAFRNTTNMNLKYRISAQFQRDFRHVRRMVVGLWQTRRFGVTDMQNIIQRFWNDELGSSLIDWCVFGAGVVSLSVAVVTTLA